MARVFKQQKRRKDDVGYHPIGLTESEVLPYARKFEVLRMEGLHYIATHKGREPPWFRNAYEAEFGEKPPA
tara:strand:+ start:404 stop:616 length:213 start_codon:yes stop_codon:yes gene_type:complete